MVHIKMDNYIQCPHMNLTVPRAQEIFELEITHVIKFNPAFRTAMKIFKENQKVHLIGIGSCVTKTVNIAEDLKSRYPNIYQKNKMFYTEVKEVWVPKSEEIQLDSLEVTRNIPSVRIMLCKGKLENSVSFQDEEQMNMEMLSLLKKEARMLRNKEKTHPHR